MTYLRARLLIIALSLIVGGPIVSGSEEKSAFQEGDDADVMASVCSTVHTPVRGGTRATTVEPTPGQKVAERQREIFVRERFEEIFGGEAIEGLTCSKGIRWDVFTDVSIPFDAADKRSSVRYIKEFLKKMSKVRTDPDFFTFFGRVMAVISSVEVIHVERIEEHASRYFGEIFPGCAISFDTKGDGDQLGSIVIVKPADGPSVKYYVKTHAGGLKA